MVHEYRLFSAALVMAALACPGVASAQLFVSGSDGTDGALSLTTTGTVVFDPVALGLDADHNGVYHFTTITIGRGVKVVLSADEMGEGRPVVWLAAGAVELDGRLDLSGGDGHACPGPTAPGRAGAGGYSGGVGETTGFPSTAGNGPGGGLIHLSCTNGASGGFGTGGGGDCGTQGVSYGNALLMPMIGGSGGAGGAYTLFYPGYFGTGGGGGGGALLLASSASITLDGAILADGGSSPTGAGCYTGGGGSGGAVRLIANRVDGTGSISAVGGEGRYGGGFGRIRIEGYQRPLVHGASSIVPPVSAGMPGPVFPPAFAPSISVEIGGVPVPVDPTGSYLVPDLTFTAAAAVTVVINAQYIPLGTALQVAVDPEVGGRQAYTTSGLLGVLEASTAAVDISFPAGNSRLYVTASW